MRGDEHGRRVEDLRLLFVVHPPQPLDAAVVASGAHHGQDRVGHLGHHLRPCREQDVQALPRLVAAQKRNPISVPFHVGLRLHIEAVGNDPGFQLRWQGGGRGMAHCGDRDAVAEHPANQAPAKAIGEPDRRAGGCVKGGHHRRPGVSGEERSQWHQRLMNMEEVELRDASQPGPRSGVDRDRHLGAVAGNGDAPAEVDSLHVLRKPGADNKRVIAVLFR